MLDLLSASGEIFDFIWRLLSLWRFIFSKSFRTNTLIQWNSGGKIERRLILQKAFLSILFNIAFILVIIFA